MIVLVPIVRRRYRPTCEFAVKQTKTIGEKQHKIAKKETLEHFDRNVHE